MSKARAVFLRLWVATFLASIAIGFAALRPDASLIVLWHLRAVAARDDGLSNRALSEGSQLRAVAPEGSALAEEDDAPQIQTAYRASVRKRRLHAYHDLAIFTGIVVLAPLLVGALGAALQRLLQRRARPLLNAR